MIDLQAEKLIPVSKVPQHCPHGRIHIATAWRWIQRGIKGRKLETVVLGGRRFTSIQALDRFFQATNEAHSDTSEYRSETTKARQREIARAEAELDELGI